MLQRLLHLFNLPLLLVGCLISPIIRILFPGVRYGHDVTVFAEWGTYANSINELYNTECFCNYPILGLLSSTGLLKLFDFDIAQFMIALSVIDFLNVFLIFAILKTLDVKFAGVWSFVIAAIPSTWAGAALWGQIDNIGQSILLLLALVLAIFHNKEYFKNKFYLFVITMGLLLSMAILTKQLLLFSVFSFGIYILYIIYNFNEQKIANSSKHLILLILAIITPILLFDAWLALPSTYSISHLQRVLMTGSDHMNEIAGNGFNIWVLFYNDMLSDASQPLFALLSPKVIGILIFIVALLFLSYTFIKKLNSQNENLINFFWFLALVNLSFNVFLTGTHDRYLYHFYPFLLIAIVSAESNIKKLINNQKLYITILGACLYGAFILSILLMIQPEYSNKILAIFHFLFFVYLIIHFSSAKTKHHEIYMQR
ncbi:MAG: hypothetical protein HKO56_06405 [Bacteroidia bacterium]|nr:hypothetical protein [Bacteroidia bacterium]NNM16271.1 hypothetical protein [Bacteroidia bacterium]